MYTALQPHGVELLDHRERRGRSRARSRPEAHLGDAANRAALRNRREMQASNDSLAAALGVQGMVINRVNTGPFRARLGSFYAKYRAHCGDEAWRLLEASVGKLGYKREDLAVARSSSSGAAGQD